MVPPDSGLEVVPPPPLSLGEKELESAGCILAPQDDYRKNFTLEVVPAPPLSLEFQDSKAADSSVFTQQNHSESRTLSRPWKLYGLCVLLTLLFIGAVIGAAVEGTRSRNDMASSSSTSTHPSTSQPDIVTSTSNPSSSPSSPVTFEALYGGGPNLGIGRWNLVGPSDRSFPLDYEHNGKLDYMVQFQPGYGAIAIEKNENGTFTEVYFQGDGGIGIGGFTLLENVTFAFAFDYEHSGHLDYLVFYVPGNGTFCILKNTNGTFAAVYGEDSSVNGIGGYDFLSSQDRAIAFDYNHSGNLDHIAVYRPGNGTFWILENVNGTFLPVYQSTSGIGGYDLSAPGDHVLTFDYAQSGKLDYIVLYRPGTGTISIVEHGTGNNNFTSVYQQGDGGSGIGGFGISSPADLAFAYDYASTGRQDHLVFYRPGTGIIWILQNSNGTFEPVYGETNPGAGIGGYNLDSSADLAYAFDYKQSGSMDHIVLYRPGSGLIYIVGKS